MIKVENVDYWGFEHAIRGMRNPMNSWDKSDTIYGEFRGLDDVSGREILIPYNPPQIGKNDLSLMKRLYKAGTEHRKYLRQIFVSMDIIAPLYWWKEFDTYKVGTVANSCSTMHKIAAKEFELDDFSHEHLGYTDGTNVEDSVMRQFEMTLFVLNKAREEYLKTKDKKYWWQMIQTLPSSYNQRRTVTMNYENVVTIIKQRTGHKLTEWGDFCAELNKLPYVKEIIGEQP